MYHDGPDPSTVDTCPALLVIPNDNTGSSDGGSGSSEDGGDWWIILLAVVGGMLLVGLVAAGGHKYHNGEYLPNRSTAGDKFSYSSASSSVEMSFNNAAYKHAAAGQQVSTIVQDPDGTVGGVDLSDMAGVYGGSARDLTATSSTAAPQRRMSAQKLDSYKGLSSPKGKPVVNVPRDDSFSAVNPSAVVLLDHEGSELKI